VVAATDDARQKGQLAGRKAVITGATSGLGRAMAGRFLAEGAEVIITGRSQTGVDAAVQELGPGAAGVVVDVRRLADLDRLATEAGRRFGQVDVLVANAGGGVFAALAAIDEALYDRQFDVNVKGVLFTVRAMLPLLRSGSSVILTASAVHAKGSPGASLYFASKAAVRSFARTLAAELAPQGIRVNSLSPGIAPTRFFANSNVGADAYAGFEQMAAAAAPLGRAASADEIAAAAVFLASVGSSYITATDLPVDGGWSSV
jgi:NAD(P)-dependent dehydrogenase (short-subunit alcohol dehydrogenase family)